MHINCEYQENCCQNRMRVKCKLKDENLANVLTLARFSSFNSHSISVAVFLTLVVDL